MPAGRASQPAAAGPAATSGFAVTTGFNTVAEGGILRMDPANGNCPEATKPLYMSNSDCVIPKIVATKLGESPGNTVYVCSTPTAPIGNVVVTGTVVGLTGGMVWKFVDSTATTVVALPETSALQAAIIEIAKRTATACTMAFWWLFITRTE